MSNTLNDYQEAAMRTAKDMGSEKMNLIHAAMGMSSDAGEFVDCIKKHAIYGKALDVNNAIEEIGDVMWFCALAAHTLGISLEEIAQANIMKLMQRYPENYSDLAAITRADKRTPEQQADLQEAMHWAVNNPAQESDLGAMSKQLGIEDNVEFDGKGGCQFPDY